MRPKTFHLSLLLLAAACASGGTSATTSAGASSAASTSASTAPRRDRSVITSEELADPALASFSVYDVIRTLRPNFLSNRGNQANQYEGSTGMDSEAGRVHASIDGHPIVSVDELKGMALAGVIEIRLLSPAAAMQKFGGAAREGPVILVRTI